MVFKRKLVECAFKYCTHGSVESMYKGHLYNNTFLFRISKLFVSLRSNYSKIFVKYYSLKWTFLWILFIPKAEFSAWFQFFSVTRSFRNHSDMAERSRSVSYYRLLMFIVEWKSWYFFFRSIWWPSNLIVFIITLLLINLMHHYWLKVFMSFNKNKKTYWARLLNSNMSWWVKHMLFLYRWCQWRRARRKLLSLLNQKIWVTFWTRVSSWMPSKLERSVCILESRTLMRSYMQHCKIKTWADSGAPVCLI